LRRQWLNNGDKEMVVIPLTLRIANSFIEKYHRHHKPVVGYKFAIGLNNERGLIGVAICGRPVARLLDDGLTIEVTRLCTDGEKNACSILYAACARIAREMGYRRIITYILETEPGTSLKASGWIYSHSTRGDTWDRPNRHRIDKHPTCPKKMFEKFL